MELAGKTALITGCAKRIGRAVALGLAAEGMNLILHYHRSVGEAKETQKMVERLGVKAYLLQADLGKFPELRSFVRKALSKRKIHLLINNASVFYPTRLGKVREKDWDDFFDLHAKAPFFLSQETGLAMQRQKEGKIINILDWIAFRPRVDFIPYCASKAALASLTEGLAKALAPEVQVNAIAPGPILPASFSTSKINRIVTQRTPLKRFGDPADIVEAVRFLAKSTDYVTGIVLPVDGGNLVV